MTPPPVACDRPVVDLGGRLDACASDLLTAANRRLTARGEGRRLGVSVEEGSRDRAPRVARLCIVRDPAAHPRPTGTQLAADGGLAPGGTKLVSVRPVRECGRAVRSASFGAAEVGDSLGQEPSAGPDARDRRARLSEMCCRSGAPLAPTPRARRGDGRTFAFAAREQARRGVPDCAEWAGHRVSWSDLST
jgi:hypothetical protein